MTLRVIQWATGPVGMAQLREIVERSDLDLAGVLVYSPAKAGLDAGELIEGVSRISRSNCQPSAETLSGITRNRNVKHQPH
jgi:hypothetical protein